MFWLGSFHVELRKAEFGVRSVHFHEEMLSVTCICSGPGVQPGNDGSCCLLRMCLSLTSSTQRKAPGAKSAITELYGLSLLLPALCSFPGTAHLRTHPSY